MTKEEQLIRFGLLSADLENRKLSAPGKELLEKEVLRLLEELKK